MLIWSPMTVCVIAVITSFPFFFLPPLSSQSPQPLKVKRQTVVVQNENDNSIENSTKKEVGRSSCKEEGVGFARSIPDPTLERYFYVEADEGYFEPSNQIVEV